MTKFIDIKLSTLKVDGESITRRPPREKKDQQRNYLELFDFNTIFSDMYYTESGIQLLGPPLLNLKGPLISGKVLLENVDISSSLSCIEKNRISKVQYSCENRESSFIDFDTDISNDILLIQPNLSKFFKDKNVLVTQQKNNSLYWIAFWLEFHIKHHNINSVIIYDNGSTTYSIDDIKNTIRLFSEIEIASVVQWDIPWGPTGGHNSVWDSDFGQHQSWEHAFSRCLSESNCAIFGDIDEFPVSEKGVAIPELISSIDEPVLSYKRRQIVEVNTDTYTDYGIRLPSDTGYYEADNHEIAPKYAINPKKLSNSASLMAHQVLNAKSFKTEDIVSRHMGNMRIDWRNQRFEPIEIKEFESFSNLLKDTQLQLAFACLQLDWLEKINLLDE